ncbi:MAG: hypothetical protein LBI05_02415 [Planctomycetaceae bacterium]|jgi:hypothetical protein|nr:hypothetical protein [Planctomycetaceae bacterium]
MKNFAKVPYDLGKKAVGSIRKMNVKGAVNTASNVALGAGIVSMIPMSAGSATEKDVERVQQYPSQRRGNSGKNHD